MKHVQRAVLLALATLFLHLPGLYAIQINEGEAQHRPELKEGNFNNSRIQTFQPGYKASLDVDIFPVDLFPGRDEGTGDLLWSTSDEDGISEHVALSEDGRYVAIGYHLNSERLEVRSALDGDLLFSYPVEAGASQVAISATGDIIAYAALDSVWMFRRNGEGIWFFGYSLQGHSPGPLALTGNGEWLVVTSIDPNTEINRVLAFHNGNPEPAWTFAVDAGVEWSWYGVSLAEDVSLVVVNSKYQLHVLELSTGEVVWETPTFNTESPVAITPRGDLIAVASLTNMLNVYYWDDEEATYIRLWRYRFNGANSTWVNTCDFSADGNTIACGTLDFYDDRYGGRLAVFDTYGDGDPLWISEDLPDEVANIDMSADGGIIAAACWGDMAQQQPDLYLYERFSPEPFYTLRSPGSLDGLSMTPNGKRLVTGGKGSHNRQFGRGGNVYVVDLELIGGFVSGRVTDEDDSPLPGVLVYRSDNNDYVDCTDENGEYSFLVHVVEEQVINISAYKVGYNYGFIPDVAVWPDETTADVDFVLTESDEAPNWLNASIDQINRIDLRWTMPDEDREAMPESGVFPVYAANGDQKQEWTGIDPWGDKDRKPYRDDYDELEGFHVFRSSLPGGPYSWIATVDAEERSYSDQHRLFPQNDYYYVITALYNDGESAYSPEVVGALNDSYLIWDADLESMPSIPEMDGVIGVNEWQGAVERDISDVFGYDLPDSAGTASALIGFSDETDELYLAFHYYTMNEITERMGVGVYVDDDGSGSWTYDRPASEGNYWGYWVEGEPVMWYRSLTGAPYNSDPYFTFEEGRLAFSDNGEYVQIEMSIPLGFHGQEEIALYDPDYTIGLGLFAIHRDQDEKTIFDGWWPQDMVSIVSYPDQFARIHIPADLPVPPLAPTDIEVVPDEEEMYISWVDPILALDSAEVDGLTGIHVYRNGELIADVRPGVSEFVDDIVRNGGWYEYSLAGYIIENNRPFEGPKSPYVGDYVGHYPEVVEYSQDDGSAEGYYVVSFDGNDNRFAVSYDILGVPEKTAVYWVDFMPGTLGPIEIYLAQDNDGVPGEPVGESRIVEPALTGEFYRFHFPATEQPVLEFDPDGFGTCWVVLHYLEDSPDKPSIGVDVSAVDDIQNAYYTSDGGWAGFQAGQIMIRMAAGDPIPSNINDEEVPLPEEFRIYQNFPNPFNSLCMIPVDLPQAALVSVSIFDTNGRIVLTRNLGEIAAGSWNIPLDAGSLGTGIYFVKVNNVSETRLIKISLIK